MTATSLKLQHIKADMYVEGKNILVDSQEDTHSGNVSVSEAIPV
jgi:hypothetical protein